MIKKINDPDKKYCEICDIHIHRASMSKHLKSKKHLNKLQNNNENQGNITNKPSSSKEDKNFNPKSLKELARDKIKLNDRELNKEIAKKMLNPYYFKDKDFYNFLKINLDSHHINHLNSKITISSTSTEYNSY